ncbi:MAG: site-specific DNA-methyltransferase, partial [Candidatus Marsarchaeota archaeon]|nr:site-specific DNA-methyltransferase [Candidatus Marsarchaeota archaeon]
MPELIWKGKYDEAGRRVAPLRVALPFQTVETVNESAQERQQTLDFFVSNRPNEWRNRLIWGDKKYVLPALLSEFAESIDLVYIDPPFATGADFSFSNSISDSDASFIKQPSIIEQKAYRDTWGTGMDGYLSWFYETACLLSEPLSPKGSIYVHLDWHVGAYAKAILDEVFGREHMVNEIIWRRAFAHNDPGRCGNIHDSLFLYSKADQWTWNRVLQPPNPDYIEQFFDQFDEDRGERYARMPLDAPRHGSGGNLVYEWKGAWPSKNRTWAYTIERMEEFDREGRIHYPKKGMPRLKKYETEYEGMVLQDIWMDVNKIHNQSQEQLHYPTQKPEVLLDRIIRSSSNEGDLVLDCFSGSGTTAAVAERLGRRWIAADLGRFAIHTTRKRLLGMPDVRPFVVQNLGKYERQLWQVAEFGESATARTTAYRSFILNLYHATPVSGYSWLHGLKQGRMVHVGTVDAPVTTGDVTQIVAEFRKAVGTGKDAPTTKGVDILGWDFAFELNEVARQDAEKAGIDLRLVRIPREILEKRAVEQGDIRFFELAALSVGLKQSGRKVTVSLEDFVIPLDDVPADVQ